MQPATRRLGLAIAAIAAIAISDAAKAQVPAGDSVTGSGTVNPGPVTFSFDAHSGPSGENPTGTASIGVAPNFFRGAVTCLLVSGNTARFAIGDDPFSGGVEFQVTDNAGAGVPDTLAAVLQLRGVPDCSPLPMTVPAVPISTGDIAVVDAQPPPPSPTTKDQCRNAGWRTFGAFKNHGDCVSFVATHGRNPPARPD
jgi:hypothetical protein